MPEATLPPRYDAWMRAALAFEVPGEPRSSCGSCAMCEVGEGWPAPRFRPDVKCCGYWPSLPNFQVGAILRDPEADRASLRARIALSEGVSPLGVGVPSAVVTAYQEVETSGRFGQVEAPRCPHFEAASGRCGVWRHREAVCSTWFCRTDRGALGQARWLALRRLLQAAERVVARKLAEQLGAEPCVGAAPGWGAWEGRQEAYFLATAEAADAVDWATVRAWGGFELSTLQRELRGLWRATQAVDGVRLRPGEGAQSALSEGRTLWRTWSRYDALVLTEAEQAAVLGCAGEEAGAWAARHGISRERAQELYDHGVVVPAGG